MTAIDDKVQELSDSGFAVGDALTEQGTDDAGRAWQQFASAWLMAEADGSVWVVWGATLDAFNRSGGIATHGFPISSQAATGRDDITTWDFAAGSRIFEVGGDAGTSYVLSPPLLTRYDELGGPTGSLGGPACDETSDSGLWWVQFELGDGLYNPDGNVYHLSPGIQSAYWTQGGPSGSLGAPAQDSDLDATGGEAGVFASGTLFLAPDGTVTLEPSAGGGTGTGTSTTAVHVPARAMTLDDAWAELCDLHRAGALVLADRAPAATGPLPATPKQVRLAPSVIHGVEFRYWDGTKTMRHGMEQIDPRHAVALARLAAWASTNYATTVIYHLGLSGSTDRVDCHGQGRALDFAGVQGVIDGVAYDWQILRDWGKKSVPNESNPTGPRVKAWPSGRRDLSYRLIGAPDADASATAFFQALYDFCAGEWQDLDDTASAATTPSTIGTRSFMMNPDHPASDISATGKVGSGGREAHQNHLHVQIGKTGTQ